MYSCLLYTSFQGNPDLIQIIGEDIDKIYLDMVKTVSIDPAAIALSLIHILLTLCIPPSGIKYFVPLSYLLFSRMLRIVNVLPLSLIHI